MPPPAPPDTPPGRADWKAVLALLIWQAGALSTFLFLTFLDGTHYNWWNWLLIVPINLFLAEIWPLYWLLLRPLFGA